MSKLPLILIFFASLFSSVNSACETGWFTKSSPCDTKATRIQCKEFTSFRVYGWHYFYIPLHRSDGNIELEFKVYEPNHSVYINFQSADSENLPNTLNFDDYIYIPNYGEDNIHQESFANRNQEVMVIGFKNSYFISEADMEFRYFTEHGDCKRSANKMLIIIIGASIGVFIFTGTLFCCLFRKARRQRNAMREQNENRTDPEAQIILDHNKISDFLTLEDLQKFFPKKPFKDFENPFQQTGCSICLEDFAAETICHQLYCNHIFHEICAQNWLEKHNNCPGCRVPIGKKAIEEFLEKQRKMKQDNALDAVEIQIQSREYEKE